LNEEQEPTAVSPDTELEIVKRSLPRNLTELNSRDVRDAPVILQMLFEGKEHTEIAEKLGLNRTTVTLKIHRLMDTKEFQNALSAEWVKRYRQIQIDDPREAFKQLTRLVAQTITRHIESTEDIRITERCELVTMSIRNYEAATEAELDRVLQANRLREPVDSSQAASETS
jgi:predicted transcriptional regulator